MKIYYEKILKYFHVRGQRGSRERERFPSHRAFRRVARKYEELQRMKLLPSLIATVNLDSLSPEFIARGTPKNPRVTYSSPRGAQPSMLIFIAEGKGVESGHAFPPKQTQPRAFMRRCRMNPHVHQKRLKFCPNMMCLRASQGI